MHIPVCKLRRKRRRRNCCYGTYAAKAPAAAAAFAWNVRLRTLALKLLPSDELNNSNSTATSCFPFSLLMVEDPILYSAGRGSHFPSQGRFLPSLTDTFPVRQGTLQSCLAAGWQQKRQWILGTTSVLDNVRNRLKNVILKGWLTSN